MGEMKYKLIDPKITIPREIANSGLFTHKEVNYFVFYFILSQLEEALFTKKVNFMV